MILYRKYQLKTGLPKARGLWYARPVINQTLDIEALAKHMSDHNTPYSPGVIKGVLTDMVSCIKELVLDGKNVKLDDLAIFSCGIISHHGSKSAEDFKIADNVRGVRLRARATGKLCNRQLNLEATLREQSLYNIEVKPDAVHPGGTPVVGPEQKNPADTKPGEVKPGEVKPGEPKPAGGGGGDSSLQ